MSNWKLGSLQTLTFGHSNIIHLCGRPFKDVYHMDTTLINNWNAKVGKHDFVIFLGDFCYKGRLSPKNYLDKLNGHITFIRGNHDNNNSLNTYIEDLDIYMAQKIIHCVHDPADALPQYEINLVGHVHQNWKIDVWKDYQKNLKVNVGVDVWGGFPININDILKAIDDFKNNYVKKTNWR